MFETNSSTNITNFGMTTSVLSLYRNSRKFGIIIKVKDHDRIEEGFLRSLVAKKWKLIWSSDERERDETSECAIEGI